MTRKIITYKDDDSAILFNSSEKIAVFNANFQREVEELKEFFLSLEDALGLAAPQVGIKKAICVVRLKKGVEVLCNPEIITQSQEKETMEEGCLSFPNIFLQISRAKKIEVIYQNKLGKKKKFQAEGLEARVLQHEIDHLNGVVFVDKKR